MAGEGPGGGTGLKAQRWSIPAGIFSLPGAGLHFLLRCWLFFSFNIYSFPPPPPFTHTPFSPRGGPSRQRCPGPTNQDPVGLGEIGPWALKAEPFVHCSPATAAGSGCACPRSRGGSGLGAAARDPGCLRAGISLPLLPHPNKHAAARLALLAVLPGPLFSVLIIILALLLGFCCFLVFFPFNRLVSFLLCTWWFVTVGSAGLLGGVVLRVLCWGCCLLVEVPGFAGSGAGLPVEL